MRVEIVTQLKADELTFERLGFAPPNVVQQYQVYNEWSKFRNEKHVIDLILLVICSAVHHFTFTFEACDMNQNVLTSVSIL